MHEIADAFVLSSGQRCTLYRIRLDMIPGYYLLSFPKSAGESSPSDLSEMLVKNRATGRVASDRNCRLVHRLEL